MVKLKLITIFYAILVVFVLSLIFGVKEGFALIPAIVFILYVFYKRDKYESEMVSNE